jgi:hypothetical protein
MMVAFTANTFANNEVEIAKPANKTITAFVVVLTPAKEERVTSCLTLGWANYQAWIALGHTKQDAQARSRRIIDACME